MHKKSLYDEMRKSELDISIIDDSSLFIHKRITSSEGHSQEAYDITPQMWYFSVFEVQSGKVFYIRDEKKIPLKKGVYGVLYPPFSICKVHTVNAIAQIGILVSKRTLKTPLPDEPTLFEIDHPMDSFTYEDIEKLIRQNQEKHIKIGLTSNNSGIGLSIKKKIDSKYDSTITLSEIAQSIGISSNLLSMYFKDSYGLTPSQYRKNLRVISSVESLLRSKENKKTISDIANESGYGDLSRFYKQFKSIVGTSPKKLQF